MRRTLACLALVGCGRIGFDGGSGDGERGDAPTDEAPAVCGWGAFSVPVAASVLNTVAHEYSPSLSDDELTVHFTSHRNAGARDLFQATRPDRGSAWNAPVQITELENINEDGNSAISPDDRTIYFGVGALWQATRAVRTAPFLPAAVVLGDATGFTSPSNPDVSPDGHTVYFTARTQPADQADLYEATRTTASGAFVPVRELAELDTASAELSPAISRDGLELVFASDRTGKYALYRTTRAAIGDVWAPPTIIVELDTAEDELDPDVSGDGATLWFASNVNAAGIYELYVATRTCL